MPEDYMKRMIEQAGSVIAALIFKQRGAELAEASENIESTCLNTIGLTLEAVKRMSPEALADHLAMSGANRIPRSVLLAELLLQEAESAGTPDQRQQTLACQVHAFYLLRDSMEFLSTDEQAIYRPKLAKLASRLGERGSGHNS
jgi:hypothetical protein